MNKKILLIIAAVIIGIILYVTFVVALIKVTLGIILLAVAVAILWIFWLKLKKKAKEKF